MDYVSRKRSKAASDYSSPLVRVIRGGDKFYVDGTSVAPGDVILLGTGDLVPCYARLVECQCGFKQKAEGFFKSKEDGGKSASKQFVKSFMQQQQKNEPKTESPLALAMKKAMEQNGK